MSNIMSPCWAEIHLSIRALTDGDKIIPMIYVEDTGKWHLEALDPMQFSEG